MVKLVDTADLKSAALKRAYGFDSRPGHQFRQVIASYAGIAQLVERNLAKVEVASSRLVSRSRFSRKSLRAFLFCGTYRKVGAAR